LKHTEFAILQELLLLKLGLPEFLNKTDELPSQDIWGLYIGQDISLYLLQKQHCSYLETTENIQNNKRHYQEAITDLPTNWFWSSHLTEDDAHPVRSNVELASTQRTQTFYTIGQFFFGKAQNALCGRVK
jgi:hypothetical protein